MLQARTLIGLFLLAAPGGAPAQARSGTALLGEITHRHQVRIPAAHRQILFVVVPRWTASSGTLHRFDLGHGLSWKAVGEPIAVRVGARGLGRGRGLHDAMQGALPTGPAKREGDHRSPAGVFALGTAFGTTRPPDRASRWPWRAVDRSDRFVDDPRSPHYNTWQRLPPSGRAAWRSAEHLSLYRLAIVIRHNVAPITRGAGSAVFLHSTASLKQPSVGCTVMMERDLAEILRWLRPEARPLLVQLPASR